MKWKNLPITISTNLMYLSILLATWLSMWLSYCVSRYLIIYLLSTITELCGMKESAHNNTYKSYLSFFYPAILYINYFLLSSYLIIYLLRTIAELCEMKESAHSNTTNLIYLFSIQPSCISTMSCYLTILLSIC